MLLKLPEKWKEYLLNPLHESADKVESLAIRANRVYINPEKQEAEELKKAYEQRIELLKELIREMDVFERKLIHLTDHIDLMQDEAKRMKAILKNMIKREIRSVVKETQRNARENSGDEEQRNIKYEVGVKQYLNQVEYTEYSCALKSHFRKFGNQSSGTRKSPILCLITYPFLFGYWSRPCRICGA